jgi:hypothetical protein
VLALAVVAALLVVRQLLAPWTELRTDVGAEGAGSGTFPVVEVAGLGSRGGGFAALTKSLLAQGVPVLDFDADKVGVQPLLYRPDDPDLGIVGLAEDTVAPAIDAALARAGLDPDTHVDVVAHSTGGLAVRHLVEQVPGWAERVDDLVMVAVPNHGSTVVWLETRGRGPFNALGRDMKPGSSFLDGLGYAEPDGEVYTTVAGDPLLFGWTSTGFDDQVPTTSPYLGGAANNVYPSFHGRLLRNDGVLELITATLRAE